MIHRFRFSGRVRCGALGITLLVCAANCAGESPDQAGFYLYERFDSTANTLGFISRVDSTAGYKLNRYVAFDAGLPLYIVRPSESVAATSAIQRVTDIGNAHMTARLTVVRPVLSYLGSFTVTAPTGDEQKGLSTGKATFDWNNQLERTFGRVTPFAALGVANTIADTPFFLRPYTSQGLVTHLEGGARVALASRLELGGSVYAYEPSGEQTVISRVKRGTAVASQPASASRSGRGKPGVFESSAITTGDAGIARDRGGNVWLSFGPVHAFDFQVGYSRSTTYALGTVFFGVGVNLGSIIKTQLR